MYRYDEFDDQLVRERIETFSDQIQRRLSGALAEEEFRPLRLMNGLYLQLHAYMLRVAIPYGTLNGEKLEALALIAEKWDRGYGHFTTRQNIQFNWVRLVDVPEILTALADVGMHAIQTSGNCIRNVTSDHFAGAARDEFMDPRPVGELIRQWSTDHPEFLFLPRKFKIAITGASHDRAVIKSHDIGLRMVKNDHQELGYEVSVGGGLGRTPMVGKVLREFLPSDYLLTYLESIIQCYNFFGRRDNKYKARIKILVHEMGLETFAQKVEEIFQGHQEKGSVYRVDPDYFQRIKDYFHKELPPIDPHDQGDDEFSMVEKDSHFHQWVSQNVHDHKVAGWSSVTVSLKKHGHVPGDASAQQMRALAQLARRYGQDEIRVSHMQNLILPHVKTKDLYELWKGLQACDLGTGNCGLISDIIACPGLDYCSLATAQSIPIAQKIATHFKNRGCEHLVGEMQIKISGCINACGHHHVGHIGILGLEKRGEENYQVTLGGNPTENMAVGKPLGPGFSEQGLLKALDTVVQTYLDERLNEGETFLQALDRLGHQPFKNAVYA